jgi:hypothetical protein
MANSGEEVGTAYRAGTVREVVGVFDDQEHLQIAIDDLQADGLNRANITTLAGSRRIERELGHGYANVRDIEDDYEVPRTIYVSKRSLGVAEGVLIGIAIYIPALFVAANMASRGASDGALASTVLLAGVMGGILGWWFAHRLDGMYRSRIREQLDHGGIVLWTSVYSPEQEARASAVLTRSSARDVHAHDRPVMVTPMPGWRGPSYNMSFMRFLGL